MEPTLAAVLTKLVSGAAGSLGGKLASLVWQAATGDRRGLSHPETRVDLGQLENDLLAISLTKQRSLQLPSSSVYEFITSPVMRTLTEQLILIAFAGARPTLENAMREEFRASMSAHLGAAAQDYRSLSDA